MKSSVSNPQLAIFKPVVGNYTQNQGIDIIKKIEI